MSPIIILLSEHHRKLLDQSEAVETMIDLVSKLESELEKTKQLASDLDEEVRNVVEQSE